MIASISTATLEDRLLARRLALEAEAYEELVLAAPGGVAVEPPRTRFMRGYLGIDAVPAEIRPWVEDRPAGIYEAGEEPLFESQPYMVAVRDLPGGRGRFFLVYDVTLLGESGEWLATIGWVLVSGALAVGLLGAWWGRRLANHLVAPVVHLAETVASEHQNLLAPNDEAGAVRLELSDASDRFLRITRDILGGEPEHLELVDI